MGFSVEADLGDVNLRVRGSQAGGPSLSALIFRHENRRKCATVESGYGFLRGVHQIVGGGVSPAGAEVRPEQGWNRRLLITQVWTPALLVVGKTINRALRLFPKDHERYDTRKTGPSVLSTQCTSHCIVPFQPHELVGGRPLPN